MRKENSAIVAELGTLISEFKSEEMSIREKYRDETAKQIMGCGSSIGIMLIHNMKSFNDMASELDDLYLKTQKKVIELFKAWKKE